MALPPGERWAPSSAPIPGPPADYADDGDLPYEPPRGFALLTLKSLTPQSDADTTAGSPLARWRLDSEHLHGFTCTV